VDGNNLTKLMASTRPDFSKLPGGWEPPFEQIPILWGGLTGRIEHIRDFDGCLVYQALIPEDCQKLIQLMQQSPNVEKVSVQGRKDVPDDRTGSIRTTIWAPQLALQIWRKIAHLIPPRNMNMLSATDWWQGNKNRTKWNSVGISPMLRFMRYDAGGQHYAHYDAGYIYNDDSTRTLQSIVIYLTTTDKGGATRFICDGQKDLPIWSRNHLDWTREVLPKEVLFRSQPEQGKILIFDHRICHDVELYQGNEPRIIIRGDLVFQAAV